jgi:hypothetical protein
MQSLQRLLFDRLDPDRNDFGAACCFEQRAGVSRIGLVALHVGADIGRRQQAHLDTKTIEPARPVVRRTAGFHCHQTHRTVGEPALELTAREAMRLDHAPGAIGDRELEHRFRQIHSHNRHRSGSIHVGLSLVALTPHAT